MLGRKVFIINTQHKLKCLIQTVSAKYFKNEQGKIVVNDLSVLYKFQKNQNPNLGLYVF